MGRGRGRRRRERERGRGGEGGEGEGEGKEEGEGGGGGEIGGEVDDGVTKSILSRIRSTTLSHLVVGRNAHDIHL